MNQVVENLRGFLARVESAKYNGGEDSLGKEFQEIKNRSAAFRQEGSYSTDTGGSQENLKKNRYKDILPYDQTRVPVTLLEEDAGSDYINASFIQGVDKQPRYIATQGPLSHTVLDFWRMIWQYNVKVIVMACREVELGKKKCERYWPLDQETVQYGVFTVSTVSKVIVNPEVVFRNLAVYFQEEVREVGHFQYIAWPDRGIPDSYTCFLKMIQLVRRHQGEHKAPMCVHCSAGCGRTGVICTVEYIQSLLDKQRVPSDFSIFEVVMEMRRQRPSAVQTKEQYDFLYHAITEMFEKQLKEYYSYENLQEYKAPFYADAGALKTTNRIQIHTRQKDVGLRVSLPPAQPEMSNIYAVVNKKATAQVSSPGSKSLDLRSQTSSHVQYDNVRLRLSPTATSVDPLYIPKANRTSNMSPFSSSYSLAGNPSPPEVDPDEYSQVTAPSAVPSYNHQKLENKWSQPVSSAYAEVSDRPDKSLDNYETVTDSSKGCMPAAISGIGFNCRIGKPKGPRDPPAEWSR
ncbi:tyrosine-protein phosphatase non-receptor type 18 isoform X1 [Bufo gargarizans]|uniref:tyrosine-protein phosphatase non-receptor type 18 isoform X1 n=1 Tax=Bufo gargarizans TaxID=30331 RepID=UPI001CF1A46F|nr:tyrosine-protein phosphatase non-receptor type 18 isoform X1 [Bufo gargarizans]